ncbi:hypothetical protein VPH35_059677 [Triticum aestivum]|uniref:uncharacterized protein isoform X1 n=1 Tax=Triticum aestivum TaxID=4565 RepID=UPI001D0123BE|nr:uncharacterized protein LOC123078297 isoform X1 [Triticum aestivum]
MLADRRRAEAMDRISSETKAIYDLPRADLDAALSKTTSEKSEEMVAALAKLDSKLDQLSRCIDAVKLGIVLDLDELHEELMTDCSAASSRTTPPSPRPPPATTKQALPGSGSAGQEEFHNDSDQQSTRPRRQHRPFRWVLCRTRRRRVTCHPGGDLRL